MLKDGEYSRAGARPGLPGRRGCKKQDWGEIMTVDRRTIRFPLPLALAISWRAKAEHTDFTGVVIRLCERQIEHEEGRESARSAALYSRATFLAVSELLALSKREDVETVRRSILARASRREEER